MALLRGLTTFCLLAGVAWAQGDRGIITGTVADPSNSVIPAAAITATNIESGSVHRTSSTATGNFTLSQLPAGRYTLAVESDGFNRYIQEGIRVFAAQTARIDVTLQIGATTESITVTADAALLKTENAEQSTSVTQEKLNELPINFGSRGNASSGNIRNPYSFINLVPGGNVSSYSSIKLNGAPIDTFNVRVEGQESNNHRIAVRQDQVSPSVESIEEINVQTSNFAPEYGQVAGGYINMTAKSGTNNFHGSAFAYIVNEALFAGIPFTDAGNGQHERPRARRFNYGWSVGGPVIIPHVYNGRNRTFFFFALEQYDQRETISGNIETLPATAYRTGDFGAALTGRQLAVDPLGRPIMENAIYDPMTTRTVDGAVVRDPFPNNVIPTARLDPVALKIQGLIPGTTRSGILNNWDQVYEVSTDEDIPSIKIDHSFTDNAKIAFYYSRYWGPHYNGADGLPVPITAKRELPTTTNTVRINYDHSLTPTTLLHAGVGYLRHYNPDQGLPGVLAYDAPGQLGLEGAVYGRGFPVIGGLNSATAGGMSLNMARMGYIPSSDKPTVVLSLTMVRSNHTYKFGGEWRVDGYTRRDLGAQSGNYNFSALQSGLPSTQGQNLSGGAVGVPYASFLLGMANSASVSNPFDPQHRKQSLSLFWQDNWKVTSKLTLDYGVRWDRQGRAQEIFYRTSSFDPTVPNPSAGGILGATTYEGNGAGRCNCNFSPVYNLAFGPRLGAAYRLTSKTVFRGGVGVTYSQTQANEAGDIIGIGGWNTFAFQSPAYGEAAVLLRDGLQYDLGALFAESLDPGVRPSPGQLDSPPAWVDRGGGRPPRMLQWNISLQHAFTSNLVLEVAYVGNRGAYFQANNLIDLNALSAERLGSFGLDLNSASDRSLLTSRLNSQQAQDAGFFAPYAGFPLTSTVAQSLRPYPQFNSVSNTVSPLGNTWYDALQVKATKRYSSGLDLVSSFAWQKELNTMNDVNNVFCRSCQKQISELSQPLVFVVAANYEVPKFGSNRWVRNLLGGWTVGAIMRYSSGMPIQSPGAQTDLDALVFQDTFANRVEGQPLFLHDLNGDFDPNKDFVLNPNAWEDPAPGQFGVSAPYHNDYRYARRPDEQMSIGRVFKIKERVNFSVRAEFFNVFNRINLSNPSSNNAQQTQRTNSAGVPTAGFGRINTGSLASPARNGQIVARFTF